MRQYIISNTKTQENFWIIGCSDMQRLFDLIFSALSILVLLPIFFATYTVLLFTGEGETFFVQTRVGRYGKPIKIFKFATMLKNSASMGTGTVTLKNDPRVLPVGRFLRRSKINELPQLFNVLFGDMSLIGPRPQAKRCFEAFPEDLQDIIVSVRPGLSGLGSIFFRNEELMLNDAGNADQFYDEIIMPYKGLLEEWYVRHNSLKAYFLLIIATVWVLISKKVPINWPFFSLIPDVPSKLEKYILK